MGVKVKRNKKSGKLAFRIFWQGFPNGRSWETTELLDTPENRRLVEAQAVLIAKDIKDGKFDYLAWFPYGHRAAYFAGRQEKQPETMQEYFDRWIAGKKPPLVRSSLERSYNQHWNTYLKSRLGSRIFTTLTVVDIKELRPTLLSLGIELKTVKNIMAGTLRAMCRDTQVDGVIKRSPFEDLPRKGWWPETETPPPSPFTFEQRETICDWFYRNERHYWPFVSFHLYQPVRPSESTALKWPRVDVERELAQIVRSRTLGEENPTKTKASKRRRIADFIVKLRKHSEIS